MNNKFKAQLRLIFILINIFFLNLTISSQAQAEPPTPQYKPYTREWCNLPNKISSCDLCKDFKMEREIGKHWLEMKSFWFQFHDAVKNERKKDVAEMVIYPMNLFYMKGNTPADESERDLGKMVINTPKEFIEKYDFIFNPKFKKMIIEKDYMDLSISKNLMRFIGFYSDISFSKNCDFAKISREDCQYVKIKHMTNDEILMDELK